MNTLERWIFATHPFQVTFKAFLCPHTGVTLSTHNRAAADVFLFSLPPLPSLRFAHDLRFLFIGRGNLYCFKADGLTHRHRNSSSISFILINSRQNIFILIVIDVGFLFRYRCDFVNYKKKIYLNSQNTKYINLNIHKKCIFDERCTFKMYF